MAVAQLKDRPEERPVLVEVLEALAPGAGQMEQQIPEAEAEAEVMTDHITAEMAVPVLLY